MAEMVLTTTLRLYLMSINIIPFWAPHHFLTVGQSDRPFQPPVAQVFDDQRSINSSSVIDSEL